jgi:hypothetical protein
VIAKLIRILGYDGLHLTEVEASEWDGVMELGMVSTVDVNWRQVMSLYIGLQAN